MMRMAVGRCWPSELRRQAEKGHVAYAVRLAIQKHMIRGRVLREPELA